MERRTYMIHLTGLENCDSTVKLELEEAGIEIVDIGRMSRDGGVSIIGKYNNFIFKRASYYWIAEGYMPLKNADYIYDKFRHLMVRVNGNHENTKPIDWCQPKGFDKLIEEPFKDYFVRKLITVTEFEKICEEIKSKYDNFVKNYHIDTQEGLNMFVRVIKENNIIG
jgi:hypothetical protein